MAKKKSKKKTKIKAQPKPQPPKITPHPTAGRKVSGFEAELDQQLTAGDEGQQKRGPGRPRKDPLPDQPAISNIGPELQTKVIDRMLRIPFSVWSEMIKVGEIKLQDREAEDLAAATKELLDYYIPNLPVHIIIWSNFTVAALAVFGPRLAKIQELKKQKKARAVQAESDGAGPGQGGPAAPSGSSADFPTIKDIKNPTPN